MWGNCYRGKYFPYTLAHGAERGFGLGFCVLRRSSFRGRRWPVLLDSGGPIWVAPFSLTGLTGVPILYGIEAIPCGKAQVVCPSAAAIPNSGRRTRRELDH